MIQPDKIDLAYIIDDDPTTIELVKLNNERFGFCDVLVTFTEPETAIENLEQCIDGNTDLPQMILLDINMPIIDAWSFLDRMNNKLANAGISVFILSSSANPMDIERSTSYSSVLKYIVKPFGIDKIATVLGLLKKQGRIND